MQEPLSVPKDMGADLVFPDLMIVGSSIGCPACQNSAESRTTEFSSKVMKLECQSAEPDDIRSITLRASYGGRLARRGRTILH